MTKVFANGATGVAAAGGTLAVNWLTYANSAIAFLAGLGGLVIVVYTICNARLAKKRNELEIQRIIREMEKSYEPRN